MIKRAMLVLALAAAFAAGALYDFWRTSAPPEPERLVEARFAIVPAWQRCPPPVTPAPSPARPL